MSSMKATKPRTYWQGWVLGVEQLFKQSVKWQGDTEPSKQPEEPTQELIILPAVEADEVIVGAQRSKKPPRPTSFLFDTQVILSFLFCSLQ